jgi:hypothetical protein
MKIFAITLTLFALAGIDGPDYWTVGWNSETVLDSRKEPNFSFWDYHYFDLKDVSSEDTIKIIRGRCMVYPGSVEEFMVVDVKSKEILKEFKFLGYSRLTITTEELFKGLEHIKEVSIYHHSEVDGTEPRQIVKVRRRN